MLYQSVWNSNDDFPGKLTENQYPKAAAAIAPAHLGNDLEPLLSMFTVWFNGVGSYSLGCVAFKVPSQQKRSKHCVHARGTLVFVRSRLRARIAQATHVGQDSSRVPLAMFATLKPFKMMASRCESLVESWNVEMLLNVTYGEFGM